ncbi:unnamed protein product [Rotaria sp. Silwood2]|nr:unnamed protein product [Rotaria sp. Silwood2]
MISIALLLIFSIVRYSSSIDIVSITSKTNTITFEQYKQVQFGTVMQQTCENELDQTLVQYKGLSNINSIAVFGFLNEILFIKTQFNFDFTTNYKITKRQVTITVGNQRGNGISESGNSNISLPILIQYTVLKEEGQTHGSVGTLMFIDGKVFSKLRERWK